MTPVLDVVVPVHNEETDLEPCLRRLHAHLSALPYPFRITVAENASTDGTAAVAQRVAAELPGIELLVLPEPGRGRALRTTWEDASSYTWVAAAVRANRAAGYQLASQLPVMPLGGFNGSDPSPTLAQFQQYVADKRVHWFIGSGAAMRSDGGSQTSQEIAAWVDANFDAQTIGGVTMYDLTQPTG
jgi:hypothetical protein